MNKQEIGSMTAKGGFINEADICNKFLNFQKDSEAKAWLTIMGYNPKKVQKIFAEQIPVRINLDKAISYGVSKEKYDETIKFKKADIQVRVEILIDNILHVENISLKKAKESAGKNQVDKRPVSTYQKIWGFNDNIAKWLKVFTGEIPPQDILASDELVCVRDKKKRRLFLDEIPQDQLSLIIAYFQDNKILIINDVLRGRGGLTAEWMLVTKNKSNGQTDWILKDINTVCNFYSQGDVRLSPRKSLYIGRVSMQRKGGTPDPKSLQFNINPLELFNEQ